MSSRSHEYFFVDHFFMTQLGTSYPCRHTQVTLFPSPTMANPNANNVSSLFLFPVRESSLVTCYVSATPPTFSPPASESFFVTCHVSKLTNPLLPPPPLHDLTPPF